MLLQPLSGLHAAIQKTPGKTGLGGLSSVMQRSKEKIRKDKYKEEQQQRVKARASARHDKQKQRHDKLTATRANPASSRALESPQLFPRAQRTDSTRAEAGASGRVASRVSPCSENGAEAGAQAGGKGRGNRAPFDHPQEARLRLLRLTKLRGIFHDVRSDPDALQR